MWKQEYDVQRGKTAVVGIRSWQRRNTGRQIAMLGERICCAGNVEVGAAQCWLASWELGERTGRNGQVSELCHLDRAGMGGARAADCTSTPTQPHPLVVG